MVEPQQHRDPLRIGLMVVVWSTVWLTTYTALTFAVGLVAKVNLGVELIAIAISGAATVLLARRFFRWPTKMLAVLSVVALGGIVSVISWPGSPVSVDNPVGTLQLDELSVAFATDPDGEAERIVGEVWRIEGPKKAYTRFETLELFADVGTDDRGVTTALLPTFVDEWDELRFKTRVIPIACRIVKVDGPPAVQYLTLYAPFRIGDERWIEADSCLVIDPAKSQ
jgi:hypothetical protein